MRYVAVCLTEYFTIVIIFMLFEGLVKLQARCFLEFFSVLGERFMSVFLRLNDCDDNLNNHDDHIDWT